MLTEPKLKVIDLLAQGQESKTEIAKLCNVSRATVYNWMEEPEMIAELDKRIQSIKIQGAKKFDMKLNQAIDKYWYLIETCTDVRTKQVALAYWMDRCLGKTPSNSTIDVTARQGVPEMSELDLRAEVENWKAENNDDEC